MTSHVPASAAEQQPLTELTAALDKLARAPYLIVASDFDGTLSAIAPQPDQARPVPGAVDALEQLAALPSTTVAVVSGRSLGDLAKLAPMPDNIARIGSHGLESSAGSAFRLDARAHHRLRRLIRELESLAETTPGSRVEIKPFSVAFHYRHAEPARAERALAWIHDAIDRREGVWAKPGHMVIELLVLPASKSWAIDVLRKSHPQSLVFYAGDDVTDEDVFVDLRPVDVGCKVGPGTTAASHRVDDPAAVVATLLDLARRRAAALGAATSPSLGS